MLRSTYHSIAAAAVFGLLAGLLAAKVSGQSVDDVFITYRYAQNLVLGHGFVFNPGEWVLATTAPGWGLLLAGLHGLTGVALPDLGTWGFAACLALVAWILCGEGQRRGRRGEMWAAGLLTVTCTFLWPHNGFEYPAALCCLLGAARWAELERPGRAGVAAAAAVWMRPDALLVVGCLGLWMLWDARRGRMPRRVPVRFGLLSGLGVALGMGLAAGWYGHPLPVTLGAKRAQGAWLSPETTGWGFWTSGYDWVMGTYAGPWTPVLALLGLLGLGRLLWLDGYVGRTLAASSLAVAVVYPLLEVPFYTWYAMPLVIGLLYGYCRLAGDVLRWGWRRLGRSSPMTWRRGVTYAVLLAVAVGLAAFPAYALRRSVLGYQLFDGFPRHALYRDAGRWLAEQSRGGLLPEDLLPEDLLPEDPAAVAFVEVGTIAFYSRLPMRDLTGLVTPSLRPWADKGDLAGAFAARPAPWLITTDRLDGMMGPVLDGVSTIATKERSRDSSPTSVTADETSRQPAHRLQTRDGELRIYRVQVAPF